MGCKCKDRLDVNIGKSHARQFGAERPANVLRSGGAHPRQSSKNDFVLGVKKLVSGEPREDFHTCVPAE